MAGEQSSILLIADPGAPAAIAEHLSASLSNERTDGSAPEGRDVSVRCHAYPIDVHTEFSEVVDTIDPGGQTEDVVIYLTDLPRRQGTTPVLADISVPDRFAVISIPGLGGAFIQRRVRGLARAVVAEMTSRSSPHKAATERLNRVQETAISSTTSPRRSCLASGCSRAWSMPIDPGDW
ncbi:hypothetical protein [Nocardia africana]